jgi:alpha-beta hydrolase superfamily lysophospholipase
MEEVAATIKIPNIVAAPIPPQTLLQNDTAWDPGLDTDEDDFLSIEDELLPTFTKEVEFFMSQEFPLSKWVQSHLTLNTNLAVIGNVSASILILHGEDDTRSPIEQAHLLERRLTEVNHPDHTLITYPNLGHTFHPVDGWIQPEGPIQDYVFSDLADWLKDRS